MIHINVQPTEAWVMVNLKLFIGVQTTMYLSTARTTRDHKETSPVEKNRKSSKPVAPYHDQDFLKIWRQKTFMGQSQVTSEGSHESIDGAAHTPQSKMSHHARVKCDWESKADNDEPSSPGWASCSELWPAVSGSWSGSQRRWGKTRASPTFWRQWSLPNNATNIIWKDSSQAPSCCSLGCKSPCLLCRSPVLWVRNVLDGPESVETNVRAASFNMQPLYMQSLIKRGSQRSRW